MSYGARGPVVVDTGVFGAELSPRGRPLAAAYRPVLEGRPAIISFVTAAELEYGARLVRWGPDRLKRLNFEISRARTVWPGPDLLDTYVDMRTWCNWAGHGLAGKDHEADRWIAATALSLGVPLVTHDTIFANVDGLQVLTKLGQ